MANLLARRVMAQLGEGKGKQGERSQATKSRGIKTENLTPEEQVLISKIIEKQPFEYVDQQQDKPTRTKVSFAEIGKRGLKENE